MPSIDKERLFEDLGYVPHAGQVPIHASKALRKVCACGSRFGKTTAAAMEGVAFSLQPKARAYGWVCAPTFELSTRVFREIVHVFQTKIPHMIHTLKEHDHMVKVWNLGGGICEIRGKSADSPVSLLGEGLDWLVCDELARMKPEIWQRYLSARLIDKQGAAILISTPRGRGFFWDLFRKGQPGPDHDPDYESWNLPTWSNPLLSQESIELARRQMPESIFNQEIGAAFCEGDGSVFRFVREAATGELAEPITDEQYFAGLDLAKVQDYTVLIVMDRYRRVVYLDRWNRADWAVQIQRVKEVLERYNDAFVRVDSSGLGDPILEALQDAGCQAEGYQFTLQSKTALVNNLALMLERREITLPKPDSCEFAETMLNELEAYQYTLTEQGNVRSGAPSGMHDDTVAALGLCAWECRDPSDFVAQLI